MHTLTAAIQAKIFIGLLVVLILIVLFFVLHIYLPSKAEARRLKKKMDSYPKPGIIANAKLSAEFEERRMRALNDSGFGDWFFDDHENAISN